MYQIKLTPYAKTFYTEWLLNPECSQYNMALDQTFYGDLDIERLRFALKRYVTDHVLFNSHIQDLHGQPFWVKNNNIHELEYSDNCIADTDLLNYIKQSFDLYNGPLYRFKLLRISEGIYRFIVVMHHLLMDGISLNAGFCEELSFYYNDDSYTSKYNIGDQTKLIASLAKVSSTQLEKYKPVYKEFWKQQLAGVESIDVSFLKLDTNDNKHTLFSIDNPIQEVRFSYNENVVNQLEKLKSKYKITPYVFSQCIFALLLNRYTGHERFVINYPIGIKEGLDFIYGAQVNLNLIPFHFHQSSTIIDILKQAQEFIELTTRSETKYGYYPITDILHENNNKQLLNVYFAQAYFRDQPFQFKGIKKAEVSTQLCVDGVTQHILLFEQEPIKDKVNLRVRYDKRIFNDVFMNTFITRYKTLFIEVLEDLINDNCSRQTSSYELLDKEQYQQVVYQYNQTQKDYPQDKTLHQLFEEQVLKNADRVALVYENTTFTYDVVNKKANQLARYLHRQLHIQPDDLIGICLDRSENMIIVILAILKSGAAYVPIDPKYPSERINHILNDANVKVLVTNKKCQVKLNAKNQNIFILDDQKLQHELVKEEAFDLKMQMSSSNLAYVIYTSGTTGNPKGVLQQHNNVMRLFTATQDWFHFTNEDTWVLFHSYAFDFSVWEMWGALLHGGKLIIPKLEQVRDFHFFYELCYQENVTVLNQTPTAFYQFMEISIKQFSKKRLSKLRYVIFGGEALTFASLRAWFNVYGYKHPTLINMYGITETTVHVTYKKLDENDNEKSSCIGVAIPDQKIYILDNCLRPLPIGAIGELYVGGVGLARGYLNQPRLTEEKFISNPFQTEQEKLQNKNSRLYKTGDLVRRLPNGDLEYRGRNDSQIKIRGYRIELGEIETQLTEYPDIKQAVVLIKEHTDKKGNHTKDKYLVGYYVAPSKLDEAKLHDYLTTRLPEYMHPHVLIHLTELPRTTNGKVDKSLLPEPCFGINRKYEEPTNEQQKIICDAFTAILNIEKIGVNDDFFKLGGDSLLAIQLTTTLQDNFDIQVADIFNFRTPKKLAEHSSFEKNLLRQKLEHVKLLFKNKQKNDGLESEPQNKMDTYLTELENLRFNDDVEKGIKNVLLTGATGYLGCNILNQLLTITNYNIFLLVRASTQEEAVNRIHKKFQFYFDKSLSDLGQERVFIINADIEKYDLGLSLETYQNLVKKIDSVIHAAALVKHYGDYGQFYSANVQATINLLELAKLTRLKDFHYISTCSVLHFEPDSDQDAYLYTEEDLPTDLAQWHSIYNQTKFQGEQQTIKYRTDGVNSNIYRVGNLAFISENSRPQKNIQENAFFNWLKCLLEMKCVTEDISQVQISQVDLTAEAIVKLFDKKQLENNIYHIFNPYLFDLLKIVSADNKPMLKNLPIGEFIDKIVYYLDSGIHHELIVKFLLRQGWLDDWGLKNKTIKILQNKTERILSLLNFKWPLITNAIFRNYLDYYLTKDELDDKKNKAT